LRTALVLAAWAGATSSGWAQELPGGPGRDLVYAKCRVCHDLTYLHDSAGIPAWMWEDTVTKMVSFGLDVTPEQRATIVNYLITYLGPNPPPAPTAQDVPARVDAEALFLLNCAACHGREGTGQPQKVPPLAGNPALADAQHAARVVLFGLSGRIVVDGTAYDGVMPPFGHLRDVEIAALVSYVQSRFRSAAAPIDPEAVAALRSRDYQPAELRDLRPAAR
jgi:mono/diheme cytochrome c family protein